MATSNKNGYEIDARAVEILHKHLEKEILPTIPDDNDRRMVQRRIKTALDKAAVEIRETVKNGRADNTDATAGN